MAAFALEVEQLTVNYGRTSVLWDISLQVPAGKIIGIIGPNGAGKTTFIKAVLEIVEPISGNVKILGKTLKEVRKRVAYVPQRASVDWDFPITVFELVLMGCYGKRGLCCWPRQEDRAGVQKVLALVGMEEYAQRQISQLSGGQQQRVFLARALMQDADLYFMDEPFIGVDQTSEHVIVSVLRRLQAEGKTIFIVHHDLDAVDAYFDWVIMLNTGLVAFGEVKTTFTQENLARAYGSGSALFGEAVRLAREKSSGLP